MSDRNFYNHSRQHHNNFCESKSEEENNNNLALPSERKGFHDDGLGKKVFLDGKDINQEQSLVRYGETTSREIEVIQCPKKPLHPKIRHVNLPQKLSGVLGYEEVQNLFAEMCFFARLGFLQPPCCLQCAFDNEKISGLHKSSSNEHIHEKVNCNNLVVWRVNADENHHIHPKKLNGNTLIVSCSAAKSWLRGETKHKMRWDIVANKLISCQS
mmetsp:Transcript_22461/g.31669  ORF Transcript_22461/g.31669 Transcript_22461/m.31669 type:complete len:213 (+) Transcript_22461:121-759(+)